MNDERDRMLGELRQGIGGIDPVLQQAEDYGRGMKAVQKVVRSQGQVMSETLSNNAMLWEERKLLRRENAELKGLVDDLNRMVANLSRTLEERNEALDKLEAAGGDRWRALYEDARRTLVANLHDQLDADELKERLGAMKRQNEQLLAEGATLVPLPSAAAVEEHIDREGVEL